MVSRKKVCHEIDMAESDFLLCWKTLSQFRKGLWENENLEEFLNFQGTLAGTIFRLTELYDAVSHEKTEVIDKKSSLSEKWFVHRLKTLTLYQSALKEVIYVGKTLGDSFAWFFYQKDTTLLQKHQQQEKIFSMPTGIGGIGELEFIKRVRGIESYFVLYHGITTLLRIGDISLVDLDNQEIAAIGELKSTEIKSGQVQVLTMLTGSSFTKKIHSENPKVFEASLDIQLPQKMESRFRRQLAKMSAAFKGKQNPSLPSFEKKLGKTYLDELSVLGKNLKVGRVSSQLAGDSLLLVGYEFRKAKLSSRIMKSSDINWQIKFQRVKSTVAEIIDPTSRKNSAHINTLHYHKSSEPFHLLGMTPLFWWPLDLNLIKKMIFRNAFVVTIFNQAHIIQKLTAAGYDIEFEEHSSKICRVTKEVEGKILTIELFQYFLALIQLYLFTEETIIETLDVFVSGILENDISMPARINLELLQKFM